MLSRQVRSRLFTLPGLTDVGVRDRRLLSRSGTPMTYLSGATLVDPAVPDVRLRIVLDGLVRIDVDGESVGDVGAGSLLGLPQSTQASITAVARTDVRTVVLAIPVLRVVAQRDDTVAFWMQRDSDIAGMARRRPA